MQLEIKELELHGVRTMVPRESIPASVNVLPSTWAYKVKRYPDGWLRKFEARLCARGDRQVEGIDYFEKCAPVVPCTTVMISLPIKYGWVTRQVDFSNVFVQAQLKEDVYISLPVCFDYDTGVSRSEAVMQLQQSLYGLVQAPLYWYNHMQNAL
jgi:hypothetical protein